MPIYGNSSCSGFFPPSAARRARERDPRLIAVDLRGQGQSSDAPCPIRSYTRPALADASTEALVKLGVTETVVFGWSLGTHFSRRKEREFA
jgi:pimeloyl-ACP methyl ester carboxylesterase